MEASLDNFERLGLLKLSETIFEGERMFDETFEWLNKNVVNLDIYKQIQKDVGSSGATEIAKESFGFTSFGLHFIRACIL